MAKNRSITTKIHIDDLKVKLKGNQDFIGLTENEVLDWSLIIVGIFLAYMPYAAPNIAASTAAIRAGIALAWKPVLTKIVKQDAARIAFQINEMVNKEEEILYLHMLCKEVDKIGRGHSVPTFDVVEEYYDFNEYSRYD